MRSALAVLSFFALMRFGLADFDWDDVPGNCRSQCEPVDTIFTDCAREVGIDVSVDFFRNGTLDLDNDGRPDRDEIPGPDDDDGPGRGDDNDRDDNDRDDNRDDNRDNDRDNDRDDDPAVEQRYVDCVCNKQNARTDFPNCSDCLIRNNYRDTEVGDFVRACRFPGATGVAPNTTASPTATLTTTNAAGSTILSTLAPTSTNITGTGVNNNQPAQVTGAASKLGAAQNVLMAAALAGLPAAAFL
ncbi:hypothetical protein IWZ03DRAFT_413704 [Phyllosticta citriasiana]|uniref:Uncharacterized protein n=1 Tax=Phyllosticta citriasiana TaxID=595635 RepID=A0ABR1KS95_9PEZI